MIPVARRRLVVLYAVVLALLVSLGGRLWYLQVMTGVSYASAAAQDQLRTVIVPPVPETASMIPFGKTPRRLLSDSVSRLLLLVEASVTLTTATTPLLMALAFRPVATQVNDPTPGLQLSDFPAAVNTGPAAAVTDAISAAANDSVHCTPAGALLPLLSDRFSAMEPPWLPIRNPDSKSGSAHGHTRQTGAQHPEEQAGAS